MLLDDIMYIANLLKHPTTCDVKFSVLNQHYIENNHITCNKTDRHDITGILLKVALNTIKQTNKQANKCNMDIPDALEEKLNIRHRNHKFTSPNSNYNTIIPLITQTDQDT